MAGDAVDVVGSTPISISRKSGGQLVVPLDAFQVGPAGPAVRAEWAAELADETPMLIALLRQRLASGELTVPPVRPPRPALLVTAKHPGPESNSIVVTLSPGANPATDPVGIKVTQVDTFAGLTGAADAEAKIGAHAGTKKSTGLLGVEPGAAEGLPTKVDDKAVPAAGLTVTNAKGTVFTLHPIYGESAGLKATVTSDPTAKTFTVTARYDSGPQTFSAAKPATQHEAIGYLVTVAPPPLGPSAVPAPGDLALSGGSAGTPAAALAATS